MRPLVFSAAALGFVTALGCGGLVPDFSDMQPVPPPSEDWVGAWTWSDEDDTVLLEIDADGTVSYESQSGSNNMNIAGPAESWEGELTCCFGFQSLTIDAPPSQDEDGTWTMQLDGHTYTRLAPAPAEAGAAEDGAPEEQALPLEEI